MQMYIQSNIYIVLVVSLLLNAIFLVLYIRKKIKRIIRKRKEKLQAELINCSNRAKNVTAFYDLNTNLYKNINYPTNVDMLFLGDSITANCDFNSFFCDYVVVNQGINGDTTEGLLNRLDSATKIQPKMIFIMIGINDLCNRKTLTEITNNYKAIITKLKNEVQGVEIFVSNISPITDYCYIDYLSNEEIKEANLCIEQVCKETQTKYIDVFSLLTENSDFAPDGVHLMYSGYEKIIASYKKVLNLRNS